MKVFIKVNETPKAFREVAINRKDFIIGDTFYSYNEHNPGCYYKYHKTNEKAHPLDNINSESETYVYTFDRICSTTETSHVNELKSMIEAIAVIKDHVARDVYEYMMHNIWEIIDKTLTSEAASDILRQLNENDEVSMEKSDETAEMPSKESENGNILAEFIMSSFHFMICANSKESCGNQENKHNVFSVKVRNTCNNDVIETCICNKDTTQGSNIYHTEIDPATFMVASRVISGVTYLTPNTYSISETIIAIKFITICAFIDAVGIYNVTNNFDSYNRIMTDIILMIDMLIVKGR